MEEQRAIVEAVLTRDPDARIWLFGSRADDDARGGDIDIAILSSHLSRHDRMQIRSAIAARIGPQKIDIVISPDGHEPIFRIAQDTGTRLSA